MWGANSDTARTTMDLHPVVDFHFRKRGHLTRELADEASHVAHALDGRAAWGEQVGLHIRVLPLLSKVAAFLELVALTLLLVARRIAKLKNPEQPVELAVCVSWHALVTDAPTN